MLASRPSNTNGAAAAAGAQAYGAGGAMPTGIPPAPRSTTGSAERSTPRPDTPPGGPPRCPRGGAGPPRPGVSGRPGGGGAPRGPCGLLTLVCQARVEVDQVSRWCMPHGRAHTTSAGTHPRARPPTRPRAPQGIRHVLRRHPGTWLTALLVALALAGAGVAGVMAAASAETRHRYEAAQGFADNAAVSFEVQLQQFMAPMLALSAFIHGAQPQAGACCVLRERLGVHALVPVAWFCWFL